MSVVDHELVPEQLRTRATPNLRRPHRGHSAATGVEFRDSIVISKPRVPTMSEAPVFESRLSKLEQDNRRLKPTVGALLLALREAVAHCLPTR